MRRRARGTAFGAVKRGLERSMMDKMILDRRAERDEVLRLLRKTQPQQPDCGLIRIGSESDGGYIVPDDLSGISHCISPGVSTEVRCDFELAEQGMRIVMADASVEGPPVTHPNFEFFKTFVGPSTGDGYVTLADLVAESSAGSADGDLMLQIDIEGWEFPVFAATDSDLLRRFRVMVVEFHRYDHCFGKFGATMIDAVISKLTAAHQCVHIHPNNCCGAVTRFGVTVPRVLEMTFLRRDRATFTPVRFADMPHPLERDNVGDLAPLRMTREWFAH